MEEILKDFLAWIPDNLNDIFELIDDPDKVIERYIDAQGQYYFINYTKCCVYVKMRLLDN